MLLTLSHNSQILCSQLKTGTCRSHIGEKNYIDIIIFSSINGKGRVLKSPKKVLRSIISSRLFNFSSACWIFQRRHQNYYGKFIQTSGIIPCLTLAKVSKTILWRHAVSTCLWDVLFPDWIIIIKGIVFWVGPTSK